MPKKKSPPKKATKAKPSKSPTKGPGKQPSKSQVSATARHDKFLTAVKKALTVKPQGMRLIAAKLDMVDADGAVKPSDATKIRKALAVLIETGEAVREGAQRGTTYAKAK